MGMTNGSVPLASQGLIAVLCTIVGVRDGITLTPWTYDIFSD